MRTDRLARYDTGGMIRLLLARGPALLAVITAAPVSLPAWSQQVGGMMPASTVMARGVGDSWQSQGGVVGPWWTGSAANATPSGPGSFWFGLPGLGFGGSQGSTRGNSTVAPSVTSMSGYPGVMSSGRLIPFVTGVVPVVGNGYPITTAASVTTGAMVLWSGPPQTPWMPVRRSVVGPVPAVPPAALGLARPSHAEARERAGRLVATGDRLLREGDDGPGAARAALGEYRVAARFTQDDTDLLIRQAMLQQALGRRRDADRALTRAVQLDGRLSAPIRAADPAAAGFLASMPAGIPAVAARGLAILREIAVANPTEAAPEAGGGVLAWLEASWRGRWDARAAGSPGTDDPPDR